MAKLAKCVKKVTKSSRAFRRLIWMWRPPTAFKRYGNFCVSAKKKFWLSAKKDVFSPNLIMPQKEKLFTESKFLDSSCFTFKFLSANKNTDSLTERVHIFLSLSPPHRTYFIFSSSMKDIKELISHTLYFNVIRQIFTKCDIARIIDLKTFCQSQKLSGKLLPVFHPFFHLWVSLITNTV